MLRFFHLNILTFISIGTLLSSCNSKSENFEIDLSNYKIPKKSIVKNLSQEPNASLEDKKLVENKLINFKKSSEILNEVAIGKSDPFSKEGNEINKFNSILQLTGFLNTDHRKFAFVKYLSNQGTITEESIGGINTNLLPYGAKVININPINMKLSINFENKNYIFEMQE